MFPLGTALLPSAELPLRIFEPRYRQMVLDHVDQSTDPATLRFGVVLIERGSEVGGGEVRCDVGTMARAEIVHRLGDGRAELLGIGRERFHVLEWLPDAPYPQARIRIVPETPPNSSELTRLEALENRLVSLVRQQLENSGQDADRVIAAMDVIDADPRTTDISPIQRFAARAVGQPLDQQRFLEAATPGEQLEVLDDVLQGIEARILFGRR